MPLPFPRSARRVLVTLAALAVAASAGLGPYDPAPARATELHNPRRPAEGTAAQGIFVVEYRAAGTTFDADGDFVGTLIDTVVIGVGETVQWRRLVGIHTVTSGTGAADPEAGLLFDVPHDAANPIFQYTYNVEGVFPFFCRPHEGFDMKGVIIVVGPTPTRSATWGELKAKSRNL